MPGFEERVWEASPDAYGPRSARTSFRFSAFLPDPIYGLETHVTDAVLAEIEAAAVGIRELQSSPTFRGLEAVGRQLLRAEALASSRIEGLEASQRRIARALATDEDRDETARSVIANISAMQLAVDIATGTSALTVDDILAIHDRLMVLPGNGVSPADCAMSELDWTRETRHATRNSSRLRRIMSRGS
jgi:hypothetical protein